MCDVWYVVCVWCVMRGVGCVWYVCMWCGTCMCAVWYVWCVCAVWYVYSVCVCNVWCAPHLHVSDVSPLKALRAGVLSVWFFTEFPAPSAVLGG